MLMIMIMIIIIMEDYCKSIVLNKIQSRGSTGNYVIYKSRKKNTKAKATNKMHNKVIKIHDNNSKRKQILVQSKSKILVNEAKERLSKQHEPFYYSAELNNDQNCVVP